MRKWLILAFLCSTASVEAQPIWTWVDSAGVRHYSDRPVDGAEQIEVSSPQTYSPPGSTAAPRVTPAPATTPTQQTSASASTSAYRSFAIASPAADETVWNIGGTLTVSVTLEPALAPDHRIDVYFDGRRLGLDQQSTSVSIPEVYRGTHTLQAVVIDSRTRSEIQRTPVQTFHVQQTSVQNPQSPPQGPALRRGN